MFEEFAVGYLKNRVLALEIPRNTEAVLLVSADDFSFAQEGHPVMLASMQYPITP